MKRLVCCIAAGLLVCVLGLAVPGIAQETAKPDSAARESWIGIYFQGRKIGYSSITTENASYQGKPALKLSSTSIVQIELLGSKVSQNSVSTTYTDPQYRPLYQEYNIESNGSAIKLKATYQANKIVCLVDTGGKTTQQVVRIPKGVNLVGDSSNVVQGQKIAVGQKATYHYLNPLTLSLEKTDVKVLQKANATLANHALTAYRVSTTGSFGSLTTWVAEDGDLLKGEMPLGMAMYGEEKARALDMTTAAPQFSLAAATTAPRSAGELSATPGTTGGDPANGKKPLYTPPADFAVATAVSVNRPIQNPRSLHRLSLTLSGVEDKSLILSDSRQKAVPVAGKPNTYTLTIQAVDFDARRASRLPITAIAAQPYLKRTPYLEYEDADIQKIAKQLRGSETNGYSVAKRIRQWVFGYMTPDASIGVPRSCIDVYKRRKGVCRDYATLFAGVARAAGIPTRVCGGIVYGNGKFYYHAWAECWLGTWVPFDATLPTDFVDATHIKFAQGDVTDMYNVAGIVGRVKVRILNAQ